MKLTAMVKLKATPEQSDALLKTLEQANAACNALSEWAWEHQIFGQYALHRERYAAVRAETGLTAQVVVRCISKVADAYKLDKRTKRVFRPHGSIAYDERILRWYVSESRVSIWTVQGRMNIPFVCGERQRELLATQQGETDLAYRDGMWFLLTTCNIEELPLADTSGGVLGVDLGIVQLATDSEGRQYTGEPIRTMRRRIRKHRAGLQHQAAKHHSKSAYRRLVRKRRKVSRYQRWVNHNVSRRLVEAALTSRKALALEDLSGIRERDNGFGREMRWQLGNWAFDQLRQFVVYKAQRAGVPVVFVDPRNTSRTCSACGYCDKANRKSQAHFRCLKCGRVDNADCNAARNIARHGATVTCPMDGVPARPV
jgi:putative transposase